jgi:hypothetical protein
LLNDKNAGLDENGDVEDEEEDGDGDNGSFNCSRLGIIFF